jgi:hypothetical protein
MKRGKRLFVYSAREWRMFSQKKPLLHIENALGLGESIIQRINLFSSSSHNTFSFTKRRKKALLLKIALKDSRAFSFEKHFIQEPSCFEWIQSFQQENNILKSN